MEKSVNSTRNDMNTQKKQINDRLNGFKIDINNTKTQLDSKINSQINASNKQITTYVDGLKSDTVKRLISPNK